MAEKTFSESSTLISVTDLQGDIQYCNRDFINISGYAEHELIGAHHNIVRHPDMPKSAFEDLWSTVKADRPWQGMVKNRCKNGDYYWVDAYVTPVFQNGKKVGYQSVRSCPTRKQVSKAEALYRAMRQDAGKKLPKPGFWKNLHIKYKLNGTLLVLFCTVLGLEIKSGSLLSPSLSHQLMNLALFGLIIWLAYIINRHCLARVSELNHYLRMISTGDLTENIRITRNDEIGEAVASTKMIQGRLKAVMGRFADSTNELAAATQAIDETSSETQESMNHQHSQIDLVATAMHEMSATVGEIAQNTVRTSELAATADTAASSGKVLMGATRTTITALSADITEVAQVYKCPCAGMSGNQRYYPNHQRYF